MCLLGRDINKCYIFSNTEDKSDIPLRFSSTGKGIDDYYKYQINNEYSQDLQYYSKFKHINLNSIRIFFEWILR